MTITGGSALPKDDIERMVRDAEQFAEEDRARREEAETRNQGEGLVYTTEKFLAENGATADATLKSDVESKLSDLKAALGGSDVAAIRTATEDLARSSQALGSAMYAQGQPSAAAGGAGPNPGAASDADDVVDAEIVEEPEAGE